MIKTGENYSILLGWGLVWAHFSYFLFGDLTFNWPFLLTLLDDYEISVLSVLSVLSGVSG